MQNQALFSASEREKILQKADKQARNNLAKNQRAQTQPEDLSIPSQDVKTKVKKSQIEEKIKEKRTHTQVFKKASNTEVTEFIKAEESTLQFDRNYEKLITDTHAASLFLSELPRDVLDDCLKIFRELIFSTSDRKRIPTKIFEVLEAQYIQEFSDTKVSNTQFTVQNVLKKIPNGSMFDLSQRVYMGLQIILEFMDKGKKGLLTGDITYDLIQQINHSLEKSIVKLDQIQGEIQELFQKKEAYKQFWAENFAIKDKDQTPSQYGVEELDQFMVLMNKSDWKKHVKLQNQSDYSTSQSINQQMLQKAKNQSPSAQKKQIGAAYEPIKAPIIVQDPENAQKLVEKRLKRINTANQDKIHELKHQINTVINLLYEEITQAAFAIDPYRMPAHGIPEPQNENPVNLFQRQLKIEELSFELSHYKYKKTLESLVKIGKADQLAVSHRYILKWMRNLDTAIQEQQQMIMKKDQIDPRKNPIGYYLIQLQSDKIATVCVLHLMKHLFQSFILDSRKQAEMNVDLEETEVDITSKDVKITAISLFDELGNLFQKELKQLYFNKNNKKNKTASAQIEKHLYSDDANLGQIPRDARIKIGGFLTKLMCNNLEYKIGKKSYLLLKTQILKEGAQKYMGYVLFNKTFIEQFITELDKIHDLNLQIERSLPMVYKPAPWKNYYFGGYYLKQTKMIKIPPNFREAIQYLNQCNLKNTCEVLDHLGSVSWRVNPKVLEVLEWVWSNGGGMGEVPKRYNDRQITPEMMKQATYKEKLKLLKEHQLNKDSHSQRCEFLLRLSIARSFKSCNELYFPHNMDFRGRVYPIPPHLNHMGADLNRGMLEFSEGKPLTKDGLRWLKIHLANKIGKDKLPLDERAAYAEDIMDEVHKCAEDPTNNRMWLKSENPWQTLACMFELSAAMKMENPEDYISRAHIHVDGSCNGMQHYAALGRDDSGARQVNLAESPKPGDVYTAILKLVIQEMEKDETEEGKKIVDSLRGKVTRKVIKQTVMTSVYGVTFIGARKQIQRQLKDKRIFDTNGELYAASRYMAKITIKCIGDLFRDANNIKEWFAKSAKVVAHTGDSVKWVTPLGLPCVQPYKNMSPKNIISTVIQKVSIVNSLDEQPVNKAKQNSAFPPNFVHSLDSTHMMYTAIECYKKAIPFAAVHDSYWCHASNIETLNRILREKFIRLHSEPLTENLLENFKSRYPNERFPQLPLKGEFDLEEVKGSTYFFS